MHTELCSDAYLALYKAGKLTNKYKNIDRGKGVFGCAIGSNELYEWLDDNPGIAAYPLEYVNRPYVISQIDNMVSINSCGSVRTGCGGEQWFAPDQRNRRTARFPDRSIGLSWRQGVYLHEFHTHRQEWSEAFQGKTAVQRRYHHLAEKSGVLSCDRVRCDKP